MQIHLKWSSELQKRCAEIIGEVGEDEVYQKYRQGHRLAVEFCNARVAARLVAKGYIMRYGNV